MGSDAKVGYVFWCVGRALVPAATRETASSATLESLPADPRGARPPQRAPAHAHCFFTIAIPAAAALLHAPSARTAQNVYVRPSHTATPRIPLKVRPHRPARTL
jgi:hypothetical protein